MIDIVGSDSTFRLLEATLDVASARHGLIASNIANVDTPGYKAKDIAFQKELQVALELTGQGDAAPGSSGRFEYKTVMTPRVFEVSDVTPRQDGNTVDMDKELGKLSQTTGAFNKTIALYSYKLKLLKAALRD